MEHLLSKILGRGIAMVAVVVAIVVVAGLADQDRAFWEVERVGNGGWTGGKDERQIDRGWDELGMGAEMLSVKRPDGVKDAIFEGAVKRGRKVYYVWRKVSIVLNPKVVVGTVATKDGRQIRVILDDLLPGGTKQRGLAYLEDLEENEVVYAGPWTGYAQVALAVACKLFSKRVVVFLGRDDYITTLLAKKYGCRVIKVAGTLVQLQEAAAKYAKQKAAYLMPFGLDDDKFVAGLTSALRLALQGVLDDVEVGCRIWLVAGSATLVKVLYGIFPRALFGVVQVGKTVWPDQLDLSRTVLYVAPEKMYEDAVEQPPYRSVIKYDAKVWQFVEKYGRDGDVVWNVAGHN